jgi:hypothetical protein
MTFYIGAYLILQNSIDLKHDSDSWELPDTTAHQGHMGQTSNVEELLIKPEDMDLLPTQIQFGIDEWSADEEFSPDHEAFRQFYVRGEAFYVRDFVARDYWTPMFYPTGNFYVRGFTPRDYWTPVFYPAGNFYVRNFVPTDYWTDSFYIPADEWTDSFYTPTDEWSEFYPGDYS